ncbi:TPA: hypothetical protein ACR3Z0_003904 [Bacillus thuringiensis]|nr:MULTISPECIES: hypothetical protein [Bacillus cereus group]ETE95300.1 hypothetical protein C623_0222690 [Bacillus thuringiensis serovar aizawai str. Hu4-2]MCC3898959.1 hypothetical protein [Bacillus thuringiensis]MCC3936506.1 hypothetical protein [Bacillus thuringiensis]MCC3955539.1 hypothetical protein [Bacillus thuringiensis]MCC3962162.1 hypothetical protein [Bacillus thuringiensis]
MLTHLKSYFKKNSKKEKGMNAFSNERNVHFFKKGEIHVSKLEKQLIGFSEEQVFKLGYDVLTDSILIIRRFSSLIMNPSYIEIFDITHSQVISWISMISNSIHNISDHIKRKDSSYLREEIAKALRVLYSIQQYDEKLKCLVPISTANIDANFSK